MKKPEKCRYGGFNYYDIDEMDQYLEHLEQVIREAEECFKGLAVTDCSWSDSSEEWQEKYGQKQEGDNVSSK